MVVKTAPTHLAHSMYLLDLAPINRDPPARGEDMSYLQRIPGFLLACCVVSLVAGSSNAQVASTANAAAAHDPARARVLFERAEKGLDQAREHSWDPKELEAACQLLEESRRLDRSPGTLKTLANCRAYQKRIATACALYLEAAELAEDQNNLKIAKEARELASEITPYRSFLTIQVNPRLPGLRVTLDETDVLPAEYGEPVPVDLGIHTVKASAQGYLPKTERVTIGQPAENRPLDLTNLEPKPLSDENHASTPQGSVVVVVGPSSATTSPPVTRIQPNPWPYVLGGVGVTAALVGGVSGILALHDDGTVDSRCNNISPCPDVTVQGIQRRRNFERDLAWATLPAGIAAMGVAATWIILERKSPQQRKSDSTATGFSAAVDNHGGMFSLGGRF
jgi:hypothetical protein